MLQAVDSVKLHIDAQHREPGGRLATPGWENKRRDVDEHLIEFRGVHAWDTTTTTFREIRNDFVMIIHERSSRDDDVVVVLFIISILGVPVPDGF